MKPVNKLPWIFEECDEYGQSYRVHNEAPLNAMMGDPTYYNYALDKEDAKYAVHAANAYPRLVGVLREIAKPALGGKQQQYAAQAILKELGELE